MYKLVLVRHGESEWNKLNLFSGWTDIDLTETGVLEAINSGKLLKEAGYDFDVCFTSYLKRAIHTSNYILEQLDEEWIEVKKSWRLNERHYGALQGLNKAETAEKYGQQQVKLWRRSYDVQPPALKENDKRNPANQSMYRNVDKKELPLTESLKDCVNRVVPYYESEIKPLIKAGKNVIVVAHGNSLRSLVKYLDHISDEDIVNLNIPTGVPLIFEMDDNLQPVKHYYLGNQEEIAAKVNMVANQANASKNN
ncbi:MAG: 2,3-diphosphoglycerate-dependent phosphoglycerate mutase [Erysipelotrichia bacterium]|nr:2,3-diphosphoglycerate-dependent phosphoglycerate mutase [Erysipelotrichia bacterium]